MPLGETGRRYEPSKAPAANAAFQCAAWPHCLPPSGPYSKPLNYWGHEMPPVYVSEFLATSDGLALVKAFMCIEDAKLRRAIVRLVEEIVPETL
jgi:hypothetical protein